MPSHIKKELYKLGLYVYFMKRINDLQYLKLNKFSAFMYDALMFFCSIPGWIWGILCKAGAIVKKGLLWVKDEIADIIYTYKNGNKAVRRSFFIFGAGNRFYGQKMRANLFLIFQLLFIGYMIVPSGGLHWLGKVQWFQTGKTIGTVQGYMGFHEILDTPMWIEGDDSVRVLLYAMLTVFFIIGYIATWRMQFKQCRICMDIVASGKKIRSGKEDLESLLDDQFHKTLLAPSLIGIIVFTVIPTIYMTLIAFTSYDGAHDGYSNLFGWVGLEHFNEIFDFGNGGLGLTFGEILSWTLMWSFFATFSNYFLGMFVAMAINKKGIKLKKFWRTVLVMTIAIPQFVSLLYVSKLFDSSGIIGKFLLDNNLFPQSLIDNHIYSLWGDPVTAKILLIVVNIWIGIPYIMLMATGILMNIPEDLYESAKIDGASSVQQFTKITLPYMLFVTGPYLLTSFVGNLNNFNVIYLLSGGNPIKGVAGGASVGHTDLLITWLFKMTIGSATSQYYYASVIGILIFVVVAFLSLIVYNVIPSTKSEEDFG